MLEHSVNSQAKERQPELFLVGKVSSFDYEPGLQIQHVVLKVLISLKAIHPFIVRNWRKATRGSIRVSKKCAR
jgi:hypothetical protein